jgi:hypothetical protein
MGLLDRTTGHKAAVKCSMVACCSIGVQHFQYANLFSAVLKPVPALVGTYTRTRVWLHRTYDHVYMSTSNAPFQWDFIGVTTKSRFHADNLAPGTFYWFAVSAINAAGESSKSEPCRAMAAA